MNHSKTIKLARAHVMCACSGVHLSLSAGGRGGVSVLVVKLLRKRRFHIYPAWRNCGVEVCGSSHNLSSRCGR